MDSLQGIPVEYKLDTLNTPPQEQLYVTPKIGYVNAMPLFRYQHLALNSLLVHFNGDNARLSTRSTKLTVTLKLISSNGNMAFAKLRRTQSLPRPTTHAAISTFSTSHKSISSPYRLLTHNLSTSPAAQTQTTFSMLQIKTILKNTFRPSASYFFIFPFITLQT